MARSAKDIRDIINISRLSMRNDSSDEFLSEEDDSPKELNHYLTMRASSSFNKSNFNVLTDETVNFDPDNSKDIVPQNDKVKSDSTKTPKKTGRNLEEINKYNSIPPPISNTKCLKNFDAMFQYLDGTIINTWLVESNQKLDELTSFMTKADHFTEFCHFFLSKLTSTQYNELLELEFSIIIDHLTYAFHAGLQNGVFSIKDILQLAKSVIKEYPRKLTGKKGTDSMLDIILIFCSGKNEKYRKLLKKVQCTTNKKQNIQWLLSIRAFGLINLAIGVINFYKNVRTVGACIFSLKSKEYSVKSSLIQDWIIQAVEKGYVDVCRYFFNHHRHDINFDDIHDKRSRNLIYLAVMEQNHEMINFFVKNLSDGCINIPAENGNTALQHIVSKADCGTALTLLELGANVNTVNEQCDCATALHTAVMLGDIEMVQILLRFGADVQSKMGSPCTITPLSLSKELNLKNITVLLEDEQLK